jgi:hypothetical protein
MNSAARALRDDHSLISFLQSHVRGSLATEGFFGRGHNLEMEELAKRLQTESADNSI